MRALQNLLLLCVGCSAPPTGMDLAAPDLGGGDLAGPCDEPGRVCGDGMRCHKRACIPDNGTCAADRDCQGDSFCDAGVCAPWSAARPSNAMCRARGFLPAEFRAPVEKCRWKPDRVGSANVITTPVVADLDGDGKPEIAFTNQGTVGLVAMRGDCTPFFEAPSSGLLPSAQLAAADLDGDKVPELVGLSAAFRAAVFDRAGMKLAEAQTSYLQTAGAAECSGPAIADTDGDGVPEIAVAGQVSRYRKGKAALETAFTRLQAKSAKWGSLSVFADLDGDGNAELATGLKVYDGVTGADETPKSMAMMPQTGGFPQVADFNGDGKPDLLIVQSQPGLQLVTIVDVVADKILLGPLGVEGGGFGGPAAIADFDGDKVPDFAVASTRALHVYALRCAVAPRPAGCKGDDAGVLWARAIHSPDAGGGGVTAFDFNGDGRPEIVHRDNCWLRILDGADGTTRAAYPVSSGSCLELPVIADLGADGHAEIVVAADNVRGADYCKSIPEGQIAMPHPGATQGVIVLGDPSERWAAARPIWNQHSYHVTNVGDDGSVPAKESASWTKDNSYRAGAGAATEGLAPDLTAASGSCAGVTLRASICNRGAAPSVAGVRGTFYDGDPRAGGKALCTTASSPEIAPGACLSVECAAPMKPAAPPWFRAGDDGNGAVAVTECIAENNLVRVPARSCTP